MTPHATPSDHGSHPVMNPLLASMGGPDLVHILVHCIAAIPNCSALRPILPAINYYAERALLMARTHDVVCVNHPVDHHHLAFLKRMNIGPAESNIIVCGTDHKNTSSNLPRRLLENPLTIQRIAERVRGFERIVLHPLYACHDIFHVAKALSRNLGREIEVIGGNPEIAYNASLKHHTRTRALQLGIPVAPGEVVELSTSNGTLPNLPELREAIARQATSTGRAIVRGSSGSSGSATFLATRDPASIETVVKAITAQRSNQVYLVEACVKNLVSPNIQVFIDPNKSSVFSPSVTDQVLSSDLKHTGNARPSYAQTLPHMLDATRKLAGQLREQGLTGTAGFDCVEYNDPAAGDRQWFLAEINPRINAAAYPTALMHRLNKRAKHSGRIQAFHATTIPTSIRSFAELEKRYGHLFFDPESCRGLFPYNIGCLKGGTFDAAFMGSSREEAAAMAGDFMGLVA